MAAAKKKVAKKKKAAKKGKARESLIVSSKAKAVLKKAKCNVAGDAFDGLNTWGYWLLEQASQRAKANGRKTVRAHDFFVG